MSPANIGSIHPLRPRRSNTVTTNSSPTLKPGSESKQALRAKDPTKHISSCLAAPQHTNPLLQMDFQWPVAQLPEPPPTPKHSEGHIRFKTVRLGHSIRRSSIGIVPEEHEESTPPKDGFLTTGLNRQTSRASHNSYSATLEAFDMYSSPIGSWLPSRSPESESVEESISPRKKCECRQLDQSG